MVCVCLQNSGGKGSPPGMSGIESTDVDTKVPQMRTNRLLRVCYPRGFGQTAFSLAKTQRWGSGGAHNGNLGRLRSAGGGGRSLARENWRQVNKERS